jgi:hypothetical protein
MITGLTLYVNLDKHHDWTLIPIEPKATTIPIAKAIVDGMVAQGYGATLHIETADSQVYTGPPEFADSRTVSTDPEINPDAEFIDLETQDDRPPPLAVGNWGGAPHVVTDSPQA